MKRNISKCNFKSIVGWRGDSLVCPQAFGGDCWGGCSQGCWFCFCREMEEELFSKYYSGWHRDLVRPCNVHDFEHLFEIAFGTSNESNNWHVKCLRRGIPFNMGSKSETFNLEDHNENIVVPVLELFRKYKVPVIFETKSHYVGLQKYLSIIKDMKCVVVVSIMGGSDTLNYVLEPGSPCASARWYLVKHLNDQGVWTAVRWEPILPTINSSDDDFESYAVNAKRSNAKHVSLYNYRTSLPERGQEEFEKRGFNYIRMLKGNLDEVWKPLGLRLFYFLRKHNVKASSPDFVNFPFDSDCESCCGTDGLFEPYHFTFQYACRLIKTKGNVSWSDMESVPFAEPEARARMKKIWNGGGGYYSLADSRQIKVLDRDSDGKNIYGRANPSETSGKKGLLF